MISFVRAFVCVGKSITRSRVIQYCSLQFSDIRRLFYISYPTKFTMISDSEMPKNTTSIASQSMNIPSTGTDNNNDLTNQVERDIEKSQDTLLGNESSASLVNNAELLGSTTTTGITTAADNNEENEEYMIAGEETGGANGNEDEDEDEDDDAEEEGVDAEQEAELTRITRPIFDNPISLINLDADIDEFLGAKRISDAVKLITKNFPKLPSKKRMSYIHTAVATGEGKVEILKRRNRENAALTRKRQRIYADFLDKAIEELTTLLSAEKDAVTEKLLQSLNAGKGDSKGKRKYKKAKSLPDQEPTL